MLLSVSPITFQVFRTAHTPNPMSYRDTSPSPVKMDRKYRLSQPVNCLRNHFISWESDRKKKCGFVRNHFICPGTSASPNILNYLAFGAQFNPDANTHARARTHTHTFPGLRNPILAESPGIASVSTLPGFGLPMCG